MKMECPNLVKKRIGDETFYFCDLIDKPCDFEYSRGDCEEYSEFLASYKREDCPLAGGIECCEDCSECQK